MVLSSCLLFLVTSLGAVGYARCAKHRMLSQKLVWFLSFFSQYSRIEFSRFAGEDIDSSAPYNSEYVPLKPVLMLPSLSLSPL